MANEEVKPQGEKRTIVLEPEKTIEVTDVKVRQFTDNGTDIEALIAYENSDKNSFDAKTQTIKVFEGQEYVDVQASKYNLADVQAKVDLIISGKVK